MVRGLCADLVNHVVVAFPQIVFSEGYLEIGGYMQAGHKLTLKGDDVVYMRFLS